MKKIVLILVFLLLPFSAFAQDFSTSIRGPIQLDGLSEQISKVKSLTKDDTLTIIINSPGGDVLEMSKMCLAMIKSPAKHITSVVDGMAASAAADISACSDTIKMYDNSMMLFHLGSGTNSTTHEEVIYSIDMDQTKLTESDKEYLQLIISFTKDSVRGLGFSNAEIYTAMHGRYGLIYHGTDFKITNPDGNGLRHSLVLYKDLLYLFNFLTKEYAQGALNVQ